MDDEFWVDKFFFEWVVVNVKVYIWLSCWEWMVVECLFLNGILVFLRFGEYWGRSNRKDVRVRD